jgi:hypothetical protein
MLAVFPDGARAFTNQSILEAFGIPEFQGLDVYLGTRAFTQGASRVWIEILKLDAVFMGVVKPPLNGFAGKDIRPGRSEDFFKIGRHSSGQPYAVAMLEWEKKHVLRYLNG